MKMQTITKKTNSNIEQTLEYLTQIQPPRNFLNVDSLNKIADYIKNRFEKLGLVVEYQMNYWEHGIDAVMITDTAHFRNPNYHTKNDTMDTIDFKKMQYVIDMVSNAIINLKIQKINNV